MKIGTLLEIDFEINEGDDRKNYDVLIVKRIGEDNCLILTLQVLFKNLHYFTICPIYLIIFYI